MNLNIQYDPAHGCYSWLDNNCTDSDFTDRSISVTLGAGYKPSTLIAALRNLISEIELGGSLFENLQRLEEQSTDASQSLKNSNRSIDGQSLATTLPWNRESQLQAV